MARRKPAALGVVLVLPDDPEVLDLPANPEAPLLVNTWQKVVQPAALGLTSLSVVVTGVAAVIARRNHMQELKQLHAQEAEAQKQASQERGAA
jgi:heme exporter protein D